MNRRTFLASSAALSAGVAGCLGDGSGPTTSGGSETANPDENSDDGYPAPSTVETTTESREVDPSSFGTVTTGGVDVPLVPVDVAHYWYQRREARFADARGSGQYDSSHVIGAVLSTARKAENWDKPREGPTADWPTGDRVVCYCGCPHHLSSLRAGEFIENGYEQVYAIDEGFFEWRDLGYPVTGSNAKQSAYVIRGHTARSDAGEYAWASHEASDQHEAAPIAEDGSYRLELHFRDLTSSAPIHLQTPTYELTAPLSELTGTVVTTPE